MARMMKSREAIQWALMELMREKPFKDISVTEICRRANVSRTTYYRSYYSQEEVLDDVLDTCFLEVEELLDELPAATPSTAGLSLAEQVTIYRMLQCYQKHVVPLGIILESDMDFLLEDRVRAVVLRGLGAHEDACPAELNAYLYQEYTTAGMTRVTCAWIASGCEIDIEQVLRFFASASSTLSHGVL